MKELAFACELKKILSATEQRKNRYASDLSWLTTWETLWTADRIRVGVIGVTSSGKSTLINALLGDQLLSVAVRPSSSQLVSCSYAKKRSATVYFLNGEVKTVGDTDRLRESIIAYSDESYNQHNQKQVAQLELSTPNFDLGEDVLLVDSPGLDATGYEGHEKLTLETLLPTVDVVIFVTTVKSEIDNKMKQTLDTIAKYHCPVMIVQNMLDAVRPSVDGRKSAADVAAERMNRVRLAVAQSKIHNKSDVRICQISAIKAMEYRCQKKHSQDQLRDFKRSRYESFVTGVKELVAAKRPEIEAQRVRTIMEHIQELIRQEDRRTEKIGTTVLVDQSLPALLDSMKKALTDTYREIQAVLLELQEIYDKYFPSNQSAKKSGNASLDSVMAFARSVSSKGTLGEADIKKIKNAVQRFEKRVVQSVRAFSAQCTVAMKKLNLPERDLWSYNGLPRMPEAKVKTTVVEKSRTVNKSGFWNAVKRFFTGGRHGTETEHYTETVIDHAATRKSIKGYLERLQFEYGKTLDSWHKNAQSTVTSIEQEILLRMEAIREKEKQVLDAADWKKLRKDLESCMGEYGDGKSTAAQRQKKTGSVQDVQDHTRRIKVPAKMVRLHDAAEKYLFAVQESVFRCALQACGRENFPALVVSNSPDNLAEFLYRFYRIRKQDIQKETLCRLSDRLTAVCVPTQAQWQTLKQDSGGRNVLLLINGLQFHTEYETALRRATQEHLGQKDSLFMVIQDFEILANGNAITESIRSVRLEQAAYPGMVLISHSNPLYNMAMVHTQTTQSKIKEETVFYNALTEKFPALVNESVKKRINNILRT